jgi:hypothetical protein
MSGEILPWFREGEEGSGSRSGIVIGCLSRKDQKEALELQSRLR